DEFSKKRNCEDLDDSHNETTIASAQPNKRGKYLEPTLVLITIEYRELRDRKYIAKGGFGEVHKGKWKGQNVAMKFVDHETPKILERELKHLEKSKDCKEYIIQYLGLSQEPCMGKYVLVMQFAEK
ncbi:2922_t:CDS:2, partial [Dentiscutata erythropus]